LQTQRHIYFGISIERLYHLWVLELTAACVRRDWAVEVERVFSCPCNTALLYAKGLGQIITNFIGASNCLAADLRLCLVTFRWS
jgi:hypothetical protein